MKLPKLKKYNFNGSVILSAMISAIITFSISFNCSDNIKVLLNKYIMLIPILYISVFLFIFIIIILLWKIRIEYKNIAVSRRNIILYAFPCIIVWLLYLAAFYPGVMTSDSFSQWNQAHTYVFSDWHPVMHTLFILAVTKIWDVPQAVAAVQIFIFSMVVGYGLYSLQKIGISRKILLCISVLVAVFPPNGIISITLWKDVLYNCCLAAFTIIVMNIFFTDNKWMKSKLNMIFFIFTALGILFFRHNGIVPATGTIILLMFIYRENIKKYIFVSIIIALIYIFVEYPLFTILKVTPAQSSEAFGIPVQQIAAVVKYNGYLSNEQKQEISSIMPLKSMSEHYVPYEVDYIKFQKDFKHKIIENNKIGFLKLWFNVCIQNPKIVTKAYLIQTLTAWQIFGGYTNIVPRKIDANNYNIKNKVLNQNITYWCNRILDFTQNRKVKWVFWKPALPLYIIIISGFVLAMKNGRKSLIILSTVILNILSLLISMPAQDYRYFQANYLIAVIIILAALVKKTGYSDKTEAVE